MKELILFLQQGRTAWNARAPREQMMIAAMIVVVSIALLWSLHDWTEAERIRLVRAFPAAEAQLAAMRDNAAELQRLQRQPARTTPSASAAATALETSARMRGLIVDVKAGQDRIRLTGSGNFDTIIEWLAEMQRDSGLRVTHLTATRDTDQVRIEADLTVGAF